MLYSSHCFYGFYDCDIKYMQLKRISDFASQIYIFIFMWTTNSCFYFGRATIADFCEKFKVTTVRRIAEIGKNTENRTLVTSNRNLRLFSICNGYKLLKKKLPNKNTLDQFATITIERKNEIAFFVGSGLGKIVLPKTMRQLPAKINTAYRLSATYLIMNLISRINSIFHAS